MKMISCKEKKNCCRELKEWGCRKNKEFIERRNFIVSKLEGLRNHTDTSANSGNLRLRDELNVLLDAEERK